MEAEVGGDGGQEFVLVRGPLLAQQQLLLGVELALAAVDLGEAVEGEGSAGGGAGGGQGWRGGRACRAGEPRPERA